MKSFIINFVKGLVRKRRTVYKYHDPFTYFLFFCFDYILYLRYIITNYKGFIQMNKETIKLKNSMTGKYAFVFANGPSLRKINFKKIKNYQEKFGFKVFCISSFISRGIDLIPDYYVLSDPAYFGYYEGINEKRIKDIEKDLKLIDKYKIPLFVPLQFRNRVKLNTQVFFFNDFELRWFNKNVTDITKPRSYLSMTAYKALAIACFLGFEKIYICGFDNNWFKTLEVDEENKIYYLNEHFIEQGDCGKILVSKIERDNIGEVLFNHSYLFTDLFKFPKNIINLDKESLVDAFTKKHDLDVY